MPQRAAQGDQMDTALMDDALPAVDALLLATLLGIILVVMSLAARVGGWLRERWTKRRLHREDRQKDRL